MAKVKAEKMYQCTNKFCGEYKKPVKGDKPSKYSGNLLDCENCNFELKVVKQIGYEGVYKPHREEYIGKLSIDTVLNIRGLYGRKETQYTSCRYTLLSSYVYMGSLRIT